jgi:hypothetical protein
VVVGLIALQTAPSSVRAAHTPQAITAEPAAAQGADAEDQAREDTGREDTAREDTAREDKAQADAAKSSNGGEAESREARPPARDSRLMTRDRPVETIDPRTLRARLQQKLDDLRLLEGELRGAIDRLDAGASAGDTLREVDWQAMRRVSEGLRDGRRWLGGPRVAGGDGVGPLAARAGQGTVASAEDRQRMRELLRDELPDIADRLDELEKSEPDKARELLSRVAPRLREARAVKARDPELHRLKLDELRGGLAVLGAMRAWREADRLPDGPDAEQRRAEASERLRSAIDQHYDQRLRVAQREAASLRDRLERAQADIAKRSSNKGQTVADIMSRIERGEPMDGLGGARDAKGEKPPREDR